MGGESEPDVGAASARRFEIEGKTLGFPTLFQDGSSAIGIFAVPASGAQALIRETGFEVAELWPGRADDEPERVAALSAAIHSVLGSGTAAPIVVPETEAPSASPDLEARLRELGYLE
ncbi:MAG: hypothetical protein QF890_11045 [Myxococcota bacterium]|jgi:hypothetical protein|nr:hypothetical protein [bacterium]MDP7073248.1 hypothetical protein [Myxococcota bacterium]MDP7300458.1 hypothetical protein [Myxococcota bacterium]MDP7433095.1 hypothetical protein [Myxococcota bacterium]HJO23176.1 hypothetical protein [Myxococcota bacterium]